MKQDVYIAGTGMTTFGKHMDRGLKSLAGEAITEALRDADLEVEAIEAAWIGTAAAGTITGQVCIPGQVVLRELGIGRIPVVNVENACATASTAFQQACTMITAGLYDVALVVGMEKLFHTNRQRTFDVFTGAVDIENLDGVKRDIFAEITAAGVNADEENSGQTRSLFMDVYVTWALKHMQLYGTTERQFAAVSAKNSLHGSLNPKAQYRQRITVEEVLAARPIAWPLTLPMCSPIGDGAAAAVLVSARKARAMGIADRAVKVRSSVLMSGWDYGNENASEMLTAVAARAAYESAGIGPNDLDCIEVHDASAPSEILYYEHLGLCAPGEGGPLVESGATTLGGRIPVNSSGGLLRKGHPIGATGLAQIAELNDQLLGRAGPRQVERAKVALAENGGGYIQKDSAAIVVSVLSR